MKCVALAVVALVACGGTDAPSGDENPSTLWFGMSSSREMRLVAEEPRPY